jgi:hypothetical protein
MDELALRLRNDTAAIIGLSPKARIARSFAASYRYNSRNIEGPWYGRSAQVWHDLIKDFDNMIVVPQYPLWLTTEDAEGAADEESNEGDAEDEDEIDEDEIDEDETLSRLSIADQPEIRIEPDDDSELENCVQIDITEDSIRTLPEHNAAQLFPDFVILHLRVRTLRPDHPRFLQRAGMRVTHECCPIVIENKRMPRRRTDVELYDEAFELDLQERLQEAIDDLEDQCAYAFKRYKHALSIVAVAVAGDYWQYASVTFDTVSPLNDDFTLYRTTWDQLEWGDAYAFGTPESDDRLRQLHTILARKARYYPV